MKGGRWLVISAAAVLLLTLSLKLLFERVPPALIGVKRVMIGDTQIITTDFEAGFHWGVSFYHRWEFLPKTTLFLHFNAKEERGTPLEIRTQDGNMVNIEVSVPYRIIPGEGYLIVKDGFRDSYPLNVKNTAENKLRNAFSQLTSERLQIPEERQAVSATALAQLNAELKQYHIEALDVLIRRFYFSPQYEVKLQEKQLQLQLAKLDEAETEKTKQDELFQTERKKIDAAVKESHQQWEKKLQTERSRIQVLKATIQSEAALYDSTTRAQADANQRILEVEGKLTLKRAEAERDRLRNAALSGRGGRVLLALDAVKNLRIPKVVLNSDDPNTPMLLDLERLTELFIGVESRPKN
ncbi:MAG: SPFH domain-containing protein [Planctomycetota bacterium]